MHCSKWKRLPKMTMLGTVFWMSLLLFGYLVAPSALAWGWVKWKKQRPRLWTVSSTLSFVGFLLASVSAIFALWMVVYASAGGFEHTPNMTTYSPNYSLFFRWMQRGEVLSLVAVAFTVGGVFKRSAIRWQAPASAVGTLAFWLIVTTWP
jgi:hypothetical protein